jgi:hypothetical protein
MPRVFHIASFVTHSGFPGVPARAHSTPGTLVFLQAAR